VLSGTLIWKKAAKKAVDDQAAKKAYEDAVMKHLSPEHV